MGRYEGKTAVITDAIEVGDLRRVRRGRSKAQLEAAAK